MELIKNIFPSKLTARKVSSPASDESLMRTWLDVRNFHQHGMPSPQTSTLHQHHEGKSQLRKLLGKLSIGKPTLCELMMANMVYGNWEKLRQNFPTESCKNLERLGFVTSWQSKLFYLNWKTIHTSDLSRENIKELYHGLFNLSFSRHKVWLPDFAEGLQGKFPSDLMLPRIWHMKEVHLGAQLSVFQISFIFIAEADWNQRGPAARHQLCISSRKKFSRKASFGCETRFSTPFAETAGNKAVTFHKLFNTTEIHFSRFLWTSFSKTHTRLGIFQSE